MMASDSEATPPRVFAPLLCVPQHVGIIMDGNGRWAAQHRLPRLAGHRAGVRNIRYLYTAGLPDVELVIRTGGDHRVSNFLLWQAAYAEFYSTPTYWPEFTKADLYDALAEFGRRQRRFGLVEPATVPPRPAHIDAAPLAAALSAGTGDR